VISSLVIAAIGALGIAAGVSWLVMRNAARFGLMDIPNARSSHLSPTPRGGGIGILAGIAAGLLLLTVQGAPLPRDLSIVLVGYLAIAILGGAEDVRPIPAPYRLVVQGVVAVAVVTMVGSVELLPLPPPLDFRASWLGVPLTVVWLVTVTNFYNFMDGLDGLAGGQTVASCVGIALAAWSLASKQAATIGFVLFNFPRARLFLGDVGSTSVGFLIASLPLLAPHAIRPTALFAVALGLFLFLADPLETLVRLMRSGHRLGVAHRAHSYQLLAIKRQRQNTVVIFVVACGFALSIGGALVLKMPWLAWPLLAVGLGAYIVERLLAARISDSFDHSAGARA
jgi:UDP-N-acetylmuramyl pentapeptide phosphotransferase/UDP-N-acetylglucosamine-1-phosphate transferase